MREGWIKADFAACVRRIDSGTSVNSEDEAASVTDIGVLKTSCVYTGQFRVEENKKVLQADLDRVKCPVTAGTIIVSRMNTAQLVGASCLVRKSSPNIFLPDRLWAVTVREQVDSEWFSYVVASPSIRRRLSEAASGTSGSMKNISQDAFFALPALIPPLPEQRNIARILRTWDEAIEKLEALRVATDSQYNSLARSFFDPCHPTFPERPTNWRRFGLGEVFKERDEPGNENEKLLSITMGGGVIDRDDVGRKDTSASDKSSYKLILVGDIGYNTMRMWQGVCGLSTLRGIISPAYTVVTPVPGRIEGRYASHLFKSRRMVFDFERYSQGLTSDTWNLKFPAFSRIVVYLPPIQVQVRQADLLDSVSASCNVIDRQIEALKTQKRGLLQKLLTGEWRVKVEGAL